MWSWIEGKGGKLIKAAEIEAIAVSQNIDTGKYQVLVRTKSGNTYTIVFCENREEAQKELFELASKIDKLALERA